jgi:hypothetical protein
MRRTLIVALAAGFTALTFAHPALSMPSTLAIEHGQTSAGVLDVRYRDRNGHNRYYNRGYSYGYGYRPYYRPYGYGYSRPYAYGGYPYSYYRRPGISLGLSF